MSTHTPGPWSTPHLACEDVKCNCAYVLSEGYAGSICTVEVGDGKRVSDGGNDCPPLEEAKANARLIAQAPDMYDALKQIAESGEFGCYAHTGDHTPSCNVGIARAAISKVTSR